MDTNVSNPRRALILGTLHGQAEAISRLQKVGWEAHACGHRREGPGVDAADEFHLVDILDVDAVASLASAIDAHLVYSVGSDIAMPTVAAVSERLSLPNFHSSDLIEILHRKVKLREFLRSADLSPVAFSTLTSPDDVESFEAFPAIVKPSDSQGQRGIEFVDDVQSARDAVPAAIAASASATAIIEQRLDGPEVSVHVFVVDGSIEFSLISDRLVWGGPAVGVPCAHELPTSFADKHDVEQVQQLIVDTVDALGVQTGPLYFQLKLTDSGPRIIEIAPRLDGCHLWRLVEMYTGFNILDRCFELLAGADWAPVSEREDSPALRLEFLLGAPDRPFARSDWITQDAQALYLEHQVVDGDLPRSSHPVVARLGYRIVPGSST